MNKQTFDAWVEEVFHKIKPGNTRVYGKHFTIENLKQSRYLTLAYLDGKSSERIAEEINNGKNRMRVYDSRTRHCK